MRERRRVVITGVGAITPLGLEKKQIWSALCEGKSGIKPITSFDTSAHEVHFGGEVSDFDPNRWFEVKEVRRLDRFAQFAVAAAILAIEDAGLKLDGFDQTRVGVVIGSGMGGLTELETQHNILINKGPSRISPFMIPKLMVNAAPAQVAIRFGLKGPNYALVTACTTGVNSIGEAVRIIQRGEADIMIAGGSEAVITPLALGGFWALRSALKDAQCNPGEIDYINAHATSTPVGDNIEMKAIKKVFGEHAPKIPISSTKSMLGHQLGASGSVEAIICAMVIKEGVIPPTINYETPDPECSGLDFVPNVAREKKVKKVLSNSFGFGGHNASIILGKL